MQQNLGLYANTTGGPQHVHGMQTQHIPLRKGGLSKKYTEVTSYKYISSSQRHTQPLGWWSSA